MTEQYKLIWRWYENYGKGKGSVTTESHTEYFNSHGEAIDFLDDIKRQPPDKTMKLEYKIEQVTSKLLEHKTVEANSQ